MKRIIRFYKAFGLREVFYQGFTRGLRALFPPKMHLVYARLDELCEKSPYEIENRSIKPYSSFDEIPGEVVREIIVEGTVYNRPIVNREFFIEFCSRFFREGGVLWLFNFNKKYVGYVWTILGGGISRFHLFPIIPEDALLLGAEIFPDYRGRGFNAMFHDMVLRELRKSGVERIYTGILVNNCASIRSYGKTIFRPLGIVRRRELFGKYLLLWDKKSFHKV